MSFCEEEDGHRDLPRFRPPCGVKHYSCFVVDWPHEEAKDELVQWLGGLARALGSDELVARPPLRWELVPLYRGHGPLPLSHRREGIPQRPNLKGDKRYILS